MSADVPFPKPPSYSAVASDQWTAGDYGYRIIEKQYQHILKQEDGVLEDQDPEYLHQMRVGARRLRAALRVFAPIIKLPKSAQESQVRSLARALGELRDLDVQRILLCQVYKPRLTERAQEALLRILPESDQQRQQAFIKVKKTLRQSRFKTLKQTYQQWLEAPQWSAIAPLSLIAILPDLLSPILSALLLHPGWHIPAQDLSLPQLAVLHDLRKVCKTARYQAEFFTRFYPSPFTDWIQDIKTLQEDLGQVQDTQVLQTVFLKRLHPKSVKQEFQTLLLSDRAQALGFWESIRQRYLSQPYRYGLHQMLLEPTVRS
jgi:CHAD domain-containing protein